MTDQNERIQSLQKRYLEQVLLEPDPANWGPSERLLVPSIVHEMGRDGFNEWLHRQRLDHGKQGRG